MNSEEEVRRAVLVLDNQRAQLESLVRQEELLQMSLEEHLRAKETVKRSREAGKGAEVLVPVGAGAFLILELKDDTTALLNIGSDLVVGEGIDKVLEHLNERIGDLQQAGTSVGERIQELDSKVKVQTRFVQDLYDKMKKEAPEA